MVFSSLIFIYLFLPIHLFIYYLAPEKYKNAVLLVFSLVFYAWSGPAYLLIPAFECLVSFLISNKMEKETDKNRKMLMIVEAVVVLGVLVCFKYLSFICECINASLGMTGMAFPVPKIVLPIGISFYTFQLLSYVADVYKKKVKANDSYTSLLLYTMLFHQCIAGPIVRYETVANQIKSRKTDVDLIFSGLKRFSVGLFKKAVLANSCAAVADILLPVHGDSLEMQPIAGMWIGALFYMLQIYLDFSAYSDMAIGMGRMVGFTYMENFNYPYISSSVTEFWRRWHISLGSFFRDYVYIPLGGNRVKAGKHIINLTVVWFLTGLWHGASVNFILWGLYYLLFLLIEKYLINKIPTNIRNSFLAKAVGILLTLAVVLLGWVIFRFDDTKELVQVLKIMFAIDGTNVFWNLNVETALMENIWLLLFAIVSSTPVFRYFYRKVKVSNSGISNVICKTAELFMPLLLIIIASIALVGNSYNPFLYFRF